MENDDLLAIAFLLLVNKKNKLRPYWIHPLNTRRLFMRVRIIRRVLSYEYTQINYLISTGCQQILLMNLKMAYVIN